MRLSHDRSSSLPTRFPVGAKYVVEGRGGEDGQLRVFSRYVVLPGGRRIKLPADLGQFPELGASSPRRPSQNRAGSRRPRAKKIIGRPGTTRQHRH
jgi:hypothetical protein